MQRDLAETLAARALAWLAGDEEMLELFVGSSGIAPHDLRTNAASPELLAAVLDFILLDDRWVAHCADAIDEPPEALAMARQALPGGALPNWT